MSFEARDALDHRIEQLMRGNVADDTTIERGEYRCGRVAGHITVDLALGWIRNPRSDVGAIHPSNSSYCKSYDDLDAISRKQLDGAIASQREADRLKAAWQPHGKILLDQDGTKKTVRDFEVSWYYHEACGACRGHGDTHCYHCTWGKAVCPSCAGSRGQYHHGNSGTVWQNCGGCYGSGKVPCYHCYSTTRIPCQTCSSTGFFTHMHEAQITAKIQAAYHLADADKDGILADVNAVTPRTLFAQSEMSPFDCVASPGHVVYRATSSLPYSCRTYSVAGLSFDVHTIGRDDLVPLMPPVLDHLLDGRVQAILNERDPRRIIELTDGTALTKAILAAAVSRSAPAVSQVRAEFSNAVSEELLSTLDVAVRNAYNTAAGARGRMMWVRGTVLANMSSLALVKLGVLATVVRVMGADPYGAASVFAFLTLLGVMMSIVALIAHRTAMKSARSLAGSQADRSPRMGWIPKGSLIATCLCAAYVVTTNGIGDRGSYLNSQTVAAQARTHR